MNYLFVGEDSLSKDIKISELKNKIFSSREALEFDYEVLHAHHLKAEALKKTLISLPAVSKKRLVFIRGCNKLSPRNKELIIEFINKPDSPTIIILDFDNLDEKNVFVKKLRSNIKIVRFQSKEELNVFDLTRTIGARRAGESIKILSDLLSGGVHPLQIMGGLVWFWGKSRQRMPLKNFKKGLIALQEADLNIKRSRLKPDHALELLVVKLCS